MELGTKPYTQIVFGFACQKTVSLDNWNWKGVIQRILDLKISVLVNHADLTPIIYHKFELGSLLICCTNERRCNLLCFC